MRSAWLLCFVAIAGCGRVEESRSPAPEIPDTLRDRIVASPYTFFRFTNREFAERVCEELGARSDATPTVNLHGDAHLEQYAVTADSRGLMDFDDSARGPAMVDLVRFGVSISLAAHMNDWSSETPTLLEAFWSGYRDALRDPNHVVPVPRVVERVRSGFSSDRTTFLEHAETLMRPRSMTLDEVDRALRFGIRLLTEALEEQYRDEPPGFFTVKRVGRLDTGVGSALTEKYLLRIEGASNASEDDLILEAKLLGELPSGQCLERERSDPFPVLVAQSQIANRPFDYVGYLYLDPSRVEPSLPWSRDWDGSVFIVHSWIDNYVELSADGSFESPGELREVIYDSGAQLGRGHTGRASREVGAFREQLVAMSETRYDDFRSMVETLTDELLSDWRALATRSETTP